MTIRSLTQDLVLRVAPQGGQAAARRNAWAATSAEAVLARGRRDALAALAAADRRARRSRSTGS